MPFCRARVSAKRFIAGVGGYAAGPLLTAAPSKGGPAAAAPSFSLPMMRCATSHTASIALTIEQVEQMALGREDFSVTRTDGDADVFGLAGFFRDDDLISHDGSLKTIDSA